MGNDTFFYLLSSSLAGSIKQRTQDTRLDDILDLPTIRCVIGQFLSC